MKTILKSFHHIQTIFDAITEKSWINHNIKWRSDVFCDAFWYTRP